jgi:hypothetical protein
MLRISYPQLIYKFDIHSKVIAEITIKEKQKSIGIQPMLYICFPVTQLVDENGNSINLIGRKANLKEIAYFEINHSNKNTILKSFEIFGMLTKNHQIDVINILEAIMQYC